jgi:signal transduction histidine kinase
VRKIADMYDGEAEVHSAPGVGSTFAVTLHDASLAERDAGEAAAAAAGTPPA